MKLVSLNVGIPRAVMWHGMNVTTGIFKSPVSDRIAMRTLNLHGDRQADLSVHGGKDKAVYCYPLQHYNYWKDQLPGQNLPTNDLPMGMFGENFTIDFDGGGTGVLARATHAGSSPGISLPEDSIHIGDRFAIGSAEVVVTQPRLPCYKLGVRFQTDDMVKRFLASGRTGFYLAVTREGEVGAGDDLKIIVRDPNAIPVSEITRLYTAKKYSGDDIHAVNRALEVAALPESWKEYFRQRLGSMNAARSLL